MSETLTTRSLLFVSGHSGRGADGQVVSTAITSQTNQAIANVQHWLRQAEATWQDVCTVTIFATDIREAAEITDAVRTACRLDIGHLVVVGIAGLVTHNARVELSVVAMLDRAQGGQVAHEQIWMNDGFDGDRPYTPAIIATGNRVLSISGRVGDDPEGTIVAESAEEQTHQCLRNIDNLLRAAGSTKEDIVRLGIYITDLRDHAAVVRARRAYFGDHKPTATLVQVTGLVTPGAKVEIEALAIL